MKLPVIELMEYNTLMSLIDYFSNKMAQSTVNNKNITVVSSYSNIKMPYVVPALSIEILYRKNRSIGFGSYYGDKIIADGDTTIIELEGTILEYRIQFNVYSNTRGENYKWSSILDTVFKNGEEGITLNTYLDNGNIKQSNLGNIDYNYSIDLKNNSMNPNIDTYDFHTIYELKATALQKFMISYDIMELGNIIGKLK